VPHKDPEAAKAYAKAWREANKERKAAHAKAYREANKGRVAARYKTWREANKEREVATHKTWREANKERDAATKKAWNEANKECKAATHKTWYDANKERKAVLWREWREANPDKIRAKAAHYRARKLHATPPWQSREELDAIHKGCPEGHHTDHVHPLKGKHSCGLNVPWNLQYLPDEENLSKGNKSPPPGYFDWWSEQTCVHAAPIGRVWTPTDYDNI
jgi:hypothetical protein